MDAFKQIDVHAILEDMSMDIGTCMSLRYKHIHGRTQAKAVQMFVSYSLLHSNQYNN